VYRFTSSMPGVYGIGVGSFVDPEFPAPTSEVWTELRHRWLAPIPNAVAHERFPAP
jgi:hypothetical protein